ncbi:MAG: hypothetical protein FWG44_07770 [Oscillospiraceae bacterium]|nr:hypothetical protein [Oscillospiraceae bacterium]
MSAKNTRVVQTKISNAVVVERQTRWLQVLMPVFGVMPLNRNRQIPRTLP